MCPPLLRRLKRDQLSRKETSWLQSTKCLSALLLHCSTVLSSPPAFASHPPHSPHTHPPWLSLTLYPSAKTPLSLYSPRPGAARRRNDGDRICFGVLVFCVNRNMMFLCVCACMWSGVWAHACTNVCVCGGGSGCMEEMRSPPR